jgi:hypothetical protein
MQYRYLTKNNLKISLLGFGCMRLPVINNDSANIDEIEASKMLNYAIENGINYIDTAYPYHQEQSEVFLGRYLKNGLRDKVHLATKLPVWLVDKYADFERLLDEQLERLQTDHIDFYLLHSLHEKVYRKILDLKVFDFLEEARRKGKIKYVGFSFHDELPLFKEIVDSYPWDFCQIQLNYMDRQYQAGIEGLKYAKDKGIDVIIMEPIKGGKLASAPDEIAKIMNESKTKYTPAQWALRWLYNFEEVSVVLSGMSTIDQVKENIETTDNCLPNSLSLEDLNIIDKTTEVYKRKIKVGCTECEYCLPCPSNVVIPSIFSYYNNIYVYGTEKESKDSYGNLVSKEKDVSKCIECGACEDICPQHIEIITLLKDAQKALI